MTMNQGERQRRQTDPRGERKSKDSRFVRSLGKRHEQVPGPSGLLTGFRVGSDPGKSARSRTRGSPQMSRRISHAKVINRVEGLTICYYRRRPTHFKLARRRPQRQFIDFRVVNAPPGSSERRSKPGSRWSPWIMSHAKISKRSCPAKPSLGWRTRCTTKTT